MPVEFEMPELAESVVEGEILKWLVKEGEHVALDQPLVEVMTDKVTVEVPSPFEGILLKQVAPEGAVVPIGKPIAVFGKEGETYQPGAAIEHVGGHVRAAAPDRAALAAPAAPAASNGQPGHVTSSEQAVLNAFGKPTAAPAVRKLARELGVDLTKVRGSGASGRIKRADVERVAKSAMAPSKTAAGPVVGPVVGPAAGPVVGPTQSVPDKVPLRGLRRVIADHMVASKHTAAHTLHVDEADLTELVRLRAQAKEAAATRGVKLTYLPFFVKAVCGALKRHPYVNSSLDDAAHEIVLRKDYNIGIAANTDQGLVVPVIRHADRKSIFELAGDISSLADKARRGALAHDDISDGTFTITNVGSVGGLFTFPVINHPEVAILGTHSIVERPIVRDGQIVIGNMMYLSISFDHRVVDGALAAQFLKDVIAALEQPALMLMEG